MARGPKHALHMKRGYLLLLAQRPGLFGPYTLACPVCRRTQQRTNKKDACDEEVVARENYGLISLPLHFPGTSIFPLFVSLPTPTHHPLPCQSLRYRSNFPAIRPSAMSVEYLKGK